MQGFVWMRMIGWMDVGVVCGDDMVPQKMKMRQSVCLRKKKKKEKKKKKKGKVIYVVVNFFF